jgi:hypothetical protein
MVAERALDVLKGIEIESSVWSMVRKYSYFMQHAPSVQLNRPSPVSPGADSVLQRRTLTEVLSSA